MKARTARALIWASAGAWGREGIGFAVFLILARLLGPEAYGLIAMATVTIAVARLLVADILQGPLIQREDLEPEHLDTAFWSLLGLAGLLMLAAMVAAGPIASMFGEPEVAILARGLSLLPVLDALMAVPTALLRRDMRYELLAARAILAIIAGGAVGIGMAMAGYGALSLVGHLLAQGSVNVCTLWWASEWRPRLRYSRRHFRDLRAASAYMIGVQLLVVAQNQTPRVAIGYFLGPVAAGLYVVSWRIIEILFLLFVRPLTDVTLSTFSRLQNDMQRFRQALSTALRLGALISLPTFVGLALIAPTLLPTVLGAQWGAAIPTVRVLALAGVCTALSSVSTMIPQALGRWDVASALRALTTALTVVAVILVRDNDLVAVAAAVATVPWLMLPVRFCVIRRLTGSRISEQILAYVPLGTATLVMAALVIVWQQLTTGLFTGLALLAAEVAVAAISYFAALLVLAFPLVRQAWGIFSDPGHSKLATQVAVNRNR